MHTYRHISRKSPGSGGPYHDKFFAIFSNFRIFKRKFNVNRRIVLIFIVNFRQGQGCFAARAPGYNPQIIYQQIFFMGLFKGPPAGFHILGIKSYIGIIPIHPYSNFLELFCHHSLIFNSKFPAFADEVFNPYFSFNFFLAFKAQQPFHLVFYGKAVGIPAGLAPDIETIHAFKTKMGVLNNFIPGCSQVYSSTAIWRAI